MIAVPYRHLSGVIDFSDRAIGDPAGDFAGLWEFGPGLVSAVYRDYGGPKDSDMLRRALLAFKLTRLDMMRDAYKERHIPPDYQGRMDFGYWKLAAMTELRKNTDRQLAQLTVI